MERRSFLWGVGGHSIKGSRRLRWQKTRHTTCVKCFQRYRLGIRAFELYEEHYGRDVAGAYDRAKNQKDEGYLN